MGKFAALGAFDEIGQCFWRLESRTTLQYFEVQFRYRLSFVDLQYVNHGIQHVKL